MDNNRKILVTGGAGFIGFHLSKVLLEKGMIVIGLDNMNDYYDVELKEARLEILEKYSQYYFEKGDLKDSIFVETIFVKYEPEIVVNLAAQAGVRYSIENPRAYIDANINGFLNILEACRHSYDAKVPIQHLIYASSSSVYGSNEKIPYSTEDKVDNPVSLYAATKKSNELMAHAYSKLYGIPSTGLRFFTVYGPMGRPDMAYYSFTDKMITGQEITIFNQGDMYRDFTFIDDVVEGIERIIIKAPEKNHEGVRYKIYNIGNNKPESLLYFVETLERLLSEEEMLQAPVIKKFLPMQPGDVYQTYADITELKRDFGFQPQTTLEEGLGEFVRWYKQYYVLGENKQED